jgi:hypothetical protein
MCRGVGVVTGQFVAAGETEISWNFVVGRVIDTSVATIGASYNAILIKRKLSNGISFNVAQIAFYWTYSLTQLQLFNTVNVISSMD